MLFTEKHRPRAPSEAPTATSCRRVRSRARRRRSTPSPRSSPTSARTRHRLCAASEAPTATSCRRRRSTPSPRSSPTSARTPHRPHADSDASSTTSWRRGRSRARRRRNAASPRSSARPRPASEAPTATCWRRIPALTTPRWWPCRIWNACSAALLLAYRRHTSSTKMMCVCILDPQPISFGHCVIFPKEHYSSLESTPPSIVGYVCSKLPFLGKVIIKATNVDGFDVFVTNGEVAGQVTFHTHFNIIPCKAGDGLWSSEWYKGIPIKHNQETRDLVSCIKGLISSPPKITEKKQEEEEVSSGNEDVDSERAAHVSYSTKVSAYRGKVPCLACHLNGEETLLRKDDEEVKAHYRFAHLNAGYMCRKKGCLARATTKRDIGLHEYICHGL